MFFFMFIWENCGVEHELAGSVDVKFSGGATQIKPEETEFPPRTWNLSTMFLHFTCFKHRFLEQSKSKDISSGKE